MSKSILEKNKVPHRNFVSNSPSKKMNATLEETAPFTLSQGFAMASSILALRKMPRTLFLGLIGAGVYFGYKWWTSKNNNINPES